MRIRLGLLNFILRYIEKRHLRVETDEVETRRRFSRQARWLFVDPPFATYLADQFTTLESSVPVLWASTGSPDQGGVILYLHGGGYVIGGTDTHRAMLARISALTGMRTVLPEYRLAPEHAFPAALDDAMLTYETLLARGYDPANIVLGGDSAGGGLMLALLHRICSEDRPRPGACFAFSPWTDMTMSGETITTNAKADPFLPAERHQEVREMYLAGADASDPRASPLFGSFDKAPPVLVQVGDTEILLDDSRSMVEVLKAQGCMARLDVWERVPHVWQMFQGRLREADRALEEVAAFIAETLGMPKRP